MTRVIHTGDTHIGYQQYHVPQRRADFLEAFRLVVEDAVEDGVDAVVHAGDLFHDRRPDLQDILGTLEILRILEDGDIPFLAVVGNHEAKRSGQWLDLFSSLGLATRLGRDPVRVGETAFYGLDFVPRSRRADLAYDFTPHDAEQAALVAHGRFEPFDYADWDTTRILTESTVDFDAVLLGDNHAADRAELDGTWVTYCGATERASADERADRGYNIVDFDGDDVQISRRGIPTREFVFVDLELAPGEGGDRVRRRLDEHDLDDAVVIVTIEGDGDPVVPAQVEEFAIDRGALVARVTDRREVADEGPLEVSFADPDEAVRERIRDLGLSPAAHDVDETIRTEAVADSNVRDRVRSQIEDALAAGDLEVFTGTDDRTATPSAQPDDDRQAADGDGTDGQDAAEEQADPPSDESDDESGTQRGPVADSPDGEPLTDQARAAADQASMEEFT